MKHVFAWFVVLGVATVALAQPATEPNPDVSHSPIDRRVLVISVDGLRPDLILQADCPNLRGLMQRGSYSLWAQTTPSGKTLPSHTSMMTGRHVEYHGVHWNGDDPPAGVEYLHPQAPTLFDLAKAAGYTTAMVAGKHKFKTLNRSGSIDFVSVPDGNRTDADTTAEAVAIIAEHAPQVMLLHLAETDSVGHSKNWGSHEQRNTITQADVCIGRVLDALDEQGVLDQTLIIVSADHGGFGRSHNGSDPRGLHIPWIASGPGVHSDYDLTQEPKLEIHTEDTFATACTFLEIALPEACEGKAIVSIFEGEPAATQ